MTLIALRHGPPRVAPGLCYGRSDIPGAVPDDAALDRLLDALHAATPAPIAAIDTSPLARCTALADRIGTRLGLIPRIDSRLAEMDFGRWEMRAWDDIPRAEIDAWAADIHHARPHGGESVAAVIARAASYLTDRAESPAAVLAVTHQGTIRCLRAALGQPDALDTTLGFGQFTLLHQKGLP